MAVQHGETDFECLEDGCRQRPLHPQTRERHWLTAHGQEFAGRYARDEHVDNDRVYDSSLVMLVELLERHLTSHYEVDRGEIRVGVESQQRGPHEHLTITTEVRL